MLSLSANLEKDIERNNSTLYPLIIIDNEFFISTIEESISINDLQTAFKDYGLSISNVKESININTNKFSISNLTLNFNNYKIQNQRFSDLLINKSNKFIDVYYKSQSCKNLEDCLLVYRGVISKVVHNDTKVTVTLEDLTSLSLEKDVPIANLGFSKNVFNKEYINKPIPITYGFVDKAPVIPWVDNVDIAGTTEISIIADDVSQVTGNERDIRIEDFSNPNDIPELKFETDLNNMDSPLFIYKGDYYRVLQNYNSNVEIVDEENFIAYDDNSQYSINESGQFLRIKKEFKGGYAQNAPAQNEFQTVKIQRPNQLEVLISEGGIPEDGNIGSIINTNPESGILRPEAAIDSNENPTVFFNNDPDNISEFQTFARIPNDELAPDNVEFFENNTVEVNLFANYNESGNKKGYWYPQENDTDIVERTNYLWHISSWLQANAHNLEETNIKFVSAPSGDMIITAAGQKLIDMQLRNPGEGQIFEVLNNSVNKVGIYPQYALSEKFKLAWLSKCEGIEGNEFEEGWGGNNANYQRTFDYFPEDVNNTLNPGFLMSQGDMYDRTYYNNSRIFSGLDKKTIYPSTVYKIQCDVNHDNNLQNIQNVYIGQWNDSMDGGLEDNEVFINLFDDGSDREFLYQKDDCASFIPFEIRDKHLDNSENNVLGTKYGAYYNGIEINSINGVSFNEGSSKIKTQKYAGGYGMFTSENYKISMDGLCDYDNQTGGNSGGQSWWMIVEGNIPKGNVLQNISTQQNNYLGEFFDANCNTEIKNNTLIPCGGKYSTQHTGRNFNYDYVSASNPNYVNLTIGSETTAEQRLSLLFPFPSIEADDALSGYTNTFVYGGLNVNIPSEIGTNITHQVGSLDTFLVQAYSTRQITSQDINYNSEFVGNAEDAANLLKIENIGSDNVELFNSGGSISWSVESFTDSADENNNQFESINEYRIENWDTPDKFDALALVYRIRSDEPNTENRAQISTDVNSLAVIQYCLFENVFSSSLYADVKGRHDWEFKYTDDGTLIENPTDVIYHFLEKELGLVDIIDEESLNNSRGNTSDIKFAFSVNEKIKSKKLLEELSVNGKIFPKFKSNSSFSFININREYTGSDLTIKANDIIRFEISRTPSENIKTLVNVKYKKDYEEDNYKRETGYCDGYDFFGNGENGKEVYKVIDGQEQWSSQGYNYDLLGLKRDDNILEFESNYIRDYQSASNLRDYIYLFNCNQHTIIKCTLPLKYLKLEVGDVIEFNELVNGLKAFGEDYTSNNVYRNGQKIYKYFIINSITKSNTDIKVECMQLHKLIGDFTAGKGSVSRRSILGTNAYDTENLELEYFNSHITLDDQLIYMNIIAGIDIKLTSKQKISADLTNDGSIDQLDLNSISLILDGVTPIIGDLNGDGNLNVSDIVSLIEYILGDMPYSDAIGLVGDVNQDNQINVNDLVELVNQILQSE